MKLSHITINLPPNLLALIDREAKAQNRTRSGIIAHWLIEYVKSNLPEYAKQDS